MSYPPLTTCTTGKVSESLASAFISALDVYQNDGALVGPQAILVQRRVRHIMTARFASCSRTVWASGVRRWFQAPVRKGVGSNPTAVTFSNNKSQMSALTPGKLRSIELAILQRVGLTS